MVEKPTAAPLTNDAGLLPLMRFDEPIGLTARFAGVSLISRFLL